MCTGTRTRGADAFENVPFLEGQIIFEAIFEAWQYIFRVLNILSSERFVFETKELDSSTLQCQIYALRNLFVCYRKLIFFPLMEPLM